MDKVITRATVDRETGRIQYHEIETVRYIASLDLGQSIDPSAFSVMEVHGNNPETNIYHCRDLYRYKLGTPYPAIVADVRAICRREPLLSNMPRLTIDQTGVGRPVVDLFKQAQINAHINPILIHGGDHSTWENGAYRVPKRELVAVVQVLLQTGRLKIASELPDVGVLTRELQNFQVKISDSGFDSYEARVGAHDDLVLSVAMALWMGQKAREWKMY